MHVLSYAVLKLFYKVKNTTHKTLCCITQNAVLHSQFLLSVLFSLPQNFLTLT